MKLNARIWAKLEKVVDKKREKMAGDDMEMLTDKLEKTELSSVSENAPKPLYNGALFWPHVASHHAALLSLSQLSAHHGLFRDAIYYGEQGLKVSKAVDATSFIAVCQVQLGEQWIRGGHIETGQELLDAATDTFQEVEKSLDSVFVDMSRSALYQVQGEMNDEFKTLDTARRTLLEISSSDFIESLDPFVQETSLEQGMKQLSIETSSKTRTATANTRSLRSRRPANAAKTTQASKPVAVAQQNSTEAECPPLLRLRGEIYRRQAACFLAGQNPDKAGGLLEEAETLGVNKTDMISQRVGRAECSLADALKILSTHAVYCVLPESTLLLPSIHSSSSSSSECSDQLQTANSTSTRKGKTPRRARARTPVDEDGFSDLLSKAKGCLGEIISTAVTSNSTRDNHNISYLLGRISMLSDATAGQSTSGIGDALAATHFNGKSQRLVQTFCRF